MLTGAYVFSLIQYDWINGTFHWKVNKRPMKAGSPAGFVESKGKYIKICINRKHYPAQNIAWLLVTGVYPDGIVDHKDGNGFNNRFNNLRLATSVQNAQNRKTHSRNKSGYRGVFWHKAYEKWAVRIGVNGKNLFLGYYSNLDDAIAVRKEASKKYFGEFARNE